MAQLFPSRAFRRTRERASGLLFALGVDDLSPVLTTGQTLALVRASGRTVFDSVGRVSTIAHEQYAWSSVYNSEDGVWEPTLDLQAASTNLCLRSEDFGTAWSAAGTPTRTAAAFRCGDLVLDLIGDDAAGAVEGYQQVITFTGNGVKAVSLFVRKGSSATSALRLQDTTATADRLLCAVTWSGDVPVVTMTTGTFVGAVPCYGGVYRLLFQTAASLTAANTNVLSLYPGASVALANATTGSLYAGGVQVENFGTPTAYIKTLGATVARRKDILTSAIAFAPQTLTVYCRTVNYAGINAPLFWLGTGGGPGAVDVRRFGNLLRISVTDGANVTQTVDVAMPTTSVLEFAAQFTALTTAPAGRIDTGSGFSASTTAGTGFAVWFANSLWFGTGSAPPTDDTSSLNSGIRKLIIAPGARTLAEMRGLNV